MTATPLRSRHRSRAALVVAVTTAVAASLVGAIVWVSSSGSAPSSVSAVAPSRVVTMVGGGGIPVGAVTIVGPVHGASSPSSALTVSLHYAIGDGPYALVVHGAGLDRRLGTITIRQARGTWSGTMQLPPGQVTLAMVDATGTTVCSAVLSTA